MNMSNSENVPIEQLWYTWSDVGLSSIHAGFRVRAASPGLTQIYSERVQSMDRYMRYVLPPDTNRAQVTPEVAPVGLSFIRLSTNNEYILVHKNYSGKDGVGRPGNFFVHVIALGEYSPRFLVEDAIWLWDSDLWRTNDQELDRRSNSLTPLPPNALLASNPRFDPQFRQVSHVLPFLIEAYLSRRGRTPLYIAAPASQTAQIAALIAGLALCLPRQLLADLTFSTYEPDVTKATTEIVGTSWIAPLGQESEGAQVFSPQFYREKLAVNCFTGEASRLQGHPLATHNPLAADFATYVTECLVNDTLDQLDDLCELAESSRELTIELFLQLYNNEIANADSMGVLEIERYLADAHLRVDRLGSQTFRKKVIECAAANTQWAEGHLRNILYELRGLAEKESFSSPSSNPQMAPSQEQSFSVGVSQGRPKRSQKQNQLNAKAKKTPGTLTNGLTLLAKRAIPEIVDALKKAWTASERQGDTDTEKQKVDQALILIHLMNWCLTTQNAPTLWKQLLEDLQKAPTAIGYVKICWDIRSVLLRYWSEAFRAGSPDNTIIDSLVIVSWGRLESFLKAHLYEYRKHWNTLVVERLANDASLTPAIAQVLGQSCSHEINDLLAQHVQERHTSHLTAFLIKLVEQGYPTRSLPASTHITPLLTELLRENASSLAKDLVIVLTGAGYTGNVSYQERVEELLGVLITEAAGYELLDILVKYNYPRKKRLVDVMLTYGGRQVSLESCITRVYLTAEEQNAFFLNEGRTYLENVVHVHALISLHQNLLRTSFMSGKLQRLVMLLEAPSLDEKTILTLVTNTPLDDQEHIKLLKIVGQRYLLQAQRMPNLAKMMLEWFSQLAQKYQMREVLFTLLTPQLTASVITSLLTEVELPPEEQITFLERDGEAYVSQYYRLPILLEYISTYISAFNANTLEQEIMQSSTFFRFLLSHYERLPLDEKTMLQLRTWDTVYKYCTTVTFTEPQELNALAGAIYRTHLANDTRFMKRLVHAFVSNIKTASELNLIVENMCQVPLLNKCISQLLYDIAAQAATHAKAQNGNPLLDRLLPYITFVLTWEREEKTKHFIHEFLDALLRDLDVRNIKGWKKLNETLMAQAIYRDSYDEWRFYLHKLDILDRLNAADDSGKTSVPVAPTPPSNFKLPFSMKRPSSEKVGRPLPKPNQQSPAARPREQSQKNSSF